MVDTVRSINELLALLADNTTGNISAQDMRDVVVSLDDTGWARYSDTQYTEASPFFLPANTDTILPNNAGTVLDDEKPRDIPSFYAGGKITGRVGDGILIRVDLTVKPTSALSEFIDIWFDIGDGNDRIFPELKTFPKGNGIERRISLTSSGYTLDTWSANGATLYVRSNGPVSIYDISYTITRTHRGPR